MSFSRFLSLRKSLLVMVAGLVALALYMYFYIGVDQIELVLSNINSTQYVVFYSLALLAVIGSVFFWSLAWNTILRRLSIKVSYRRAYLYYWVSFFADLVLPCATVCGELTRLYLVQKETQENYGVLASAAITNRIVAYTIVTIGLYGGTALILIKPGTPGFITNIFLTFLVGITIYMAVLLYLALSKSAAKNLTGFYLKLLKTFRPKHYRLSKIERTHKSLEDFYRGFQTFRENPKLLIKPLILHGISYLLGIVVYVLVFYALGIPSSNPEFYVVSFFIATSVQDAVASFSVGSVEIFIASIFVLYGINPAVSGITAVVLRSADFWFPLLAGFVSVQIVGASSILSLRPEDLKRRLEHFKKQAKKSSREREIIQKQEIQAEQAEHKDAKPEK